MTKQLFGVGILEWLKASCKFFMLINNLITYKCCGKVGSYLSRQSNFSRAADYITRKPCLTRWVYPNPQQTPPPPPLPPPPLPPPPPLLPPLPQVPLFHSAAIQL